MVKTVGTPREFPDFEPKDHLEIGELIGAIDMERGAKVSGSRFYFLRGVGARLEMALLQMAMEQAIDAGFVPMITPTLVRPETMQGTGFDVKHDAEIYRLAEDDLYLVGTSEVALAGYHADEILDLSAGPIRYAGQSSCYRREAGSHGKDTRGIIRVHQFNKVEMFIYTTVEDAAAEHARLLAWEEEMLAKCELPYRVIDTAAGDLGNSAARKFDCEAWVPTQGAYRELTSTSNCTTFQARRLNIRERVRERGRCAQGHAGRGHAQRHPGHHPLDRRHPGAPPEPRRLRQRPRRPAEVPRRHDGLPRPLTPVPNPSQASDGRRVNIHTGDRLWVFTASSRPAVACVLAAVGGVCSTCEMTTMTESSVAGNDDRRTTHQNTTDQNTAARQASAGQRGRDKAPGTAPATRC